MAETHTESPSDHPPLVVSEPDAAAPNQFDTPAKRGPGRPPGSKTAPGKQGGPPIAGPPAGEEGGDDPDFFEWLRTLPKADWNEQLFMYLYRTSPPIDLGKKGEWKIEKFARPITSQEILELHGSGKYKIMLDRWNPQTGHTSIVRIHYFEIMNLQYPPRVPYGPWIDKPENALWLWAKPALLEQLKAAPANGTATGPRAEGDLFKAAVEAVKSLRPDVGHAEQATLTQMVINTMEKANEKVLQMANPATMLTMVDSIIKATASKETTAGSEVMKLVTSQLDALRTELSEERKFNRELLAKITTSGTAGGQAKSFKDELLDMTEVMERIGYSRNGGSSKTDWGSVAVEVGRDLLKGLTALGSVYIQSGGLRKPPPAPAGQQPRPSTIVDTTAQLAPAQQQQAAPAPEETAMDTMTTIQRLSDQFGPLFDGAAPFLVDHFSKGATGMEFREWFCREYGEHAYRTIRQMDPRTLMGIIELRKTQGAEHVQPLLQRLAPPEDVTEFIQEFLSDRPVDEEEDEPEERERVPATRAATPAKAPEEF